jgi:hypothetical protein
MDSFSIEVKKNDRMILYLILKIKANDNYVFDENDQFTL